MLCASCLIFAGCGDDGSDPDPDAMGGTGGEPMGGEATGGNAPGDQCETTEDCLAQFGPGLVCNNGTCEFPPNCATAGEPCDPEQTPPEGFVCIGTGGMGDDVSFVCEERCDPWGAESGCGTGEWCLPTSDAAGGCVADRTGARTAGQSCAGPELGCANGTACIGYGANANGDALAYCQDYCRLDLQPGDPGACAEGFVCNELAGATGGGAGFGSCAPACTPYVSNDDCPTDWWCQASSATEGRCFPPRGGTVPPGGSCLMAACVDGTICLTEERDANDNPTVQTCVALCSPTAEIDQPGACDPVPGSPRVDCVEGLSIGDEAVDFVGYCQAGCDPWGGVGNEGCNSNQWCLPTTEIVGGCVDNGNGTQVEGESCGENIGTCQARLLCIGGTCRPVCQLDATAGDVGFCEAEPGQQAVCNPLIFTNTNEPTPFGSCEFSECSPRQDPTGCAPTETCVASSVDNAMTDIDERDFGNCQESCTFSPDGSTGCDTDPNSFCRPRDFTQANAQANGGQPVTIGTDVCVDFSAFTDSPDVMEWPLAEGANCTAVGLEEFQFCGPFSLCLQIEDISNDVLCYDFCRRSAGGYNMPNHPDCTQNADRSCVGNFLTIGEFGVGVCLGGTFN